MGDPMYPPIVKTYEVRKENDSGRISLFLHDVMEDGSANAVCEALDGIRRYGLVTYQGERLGELR